VTGHFTDYTIRVLNQGGQSATIMSLICANDRDVMIAAQVLAHPSGMEIWDGDRLVASFPAGSAKAAA
jgi:hypothetical protein